MSGEKDGFDENTASTAASTVRRSIGTLALYDAIQMKGVANCYLKHTNNANRLGMVSLAT